QGTFRRGRARNSSRVLALLARAGGGSCPYPRRSDAPARLHRVVELPGRAHPQQHTGVRNVTPRSFEVFAIVFAVVYALAYVVAVEANYALFTYHPALKEWGAGVQKARDGPAMYWFGWLVTSALAAAGAGA